MLKRLYIILENYNYPELKSFLVDIRMAQIEIVPYVPADLEAGESYGVSDGRQEAVPGMDSDDPGCVMDSYLVTDCGQGVAFARKTGIGYVFYERADAVSINDAECIIQSFGNIDADFIFKMYLRHHHLPWIILETDRLRLREMTVEDVDRLYEIYAEPSITLYTEPLYEDRNEEIEYTKSYIRNQYEFFGYGLWIVEEKEECGDKDESNLPAHRERSGARIVGRAGITRREGYEEAELGYIIEKDRQNRGYATEVCRAIIGYAAKVLEMSGLNCFVQPENLISIKLCRRLGFRYLEDVYINGILMNRYHLDLGEVDNGCYF